MYKLDLLGFSTSLLCAIHCAVLPFIITLMSLSGLHFLADPKIELGVIVLSLFIASFSFIRSYFNSHKQIEAILIVALGFIFILSSRFFPEGSIEVSLTTIGALLVATSHLVNLRLIKRYSRS